MCAILCITTLWLLHSDYTVCLNLVCNSIFLTKDIECPFVYFESSGYISSHHMSHSVLIQPYTVFLCSLLTATLYLELLCDVALLIKYSLIPLSIFSHIQYKPFLSFCISLDYIPVIFLLPRLSPSLSPTSFVFLSMFFQHLPVYTGQGPAAAQGCLTSLMNLTLSFTSFPAAFLTCPPSHSS